MSLRAVCPPTKLGNVGIEPILPQSNCMILDLEFNPMMAVEHEYQRTFRGDLYRVTGGSSDMVTSTGDYREIRPQSPSPPAQALAREALRNAHKVCTARAYFLYLG